MKMKTVGPEVLYVTAIVILVSIVLWLAVFFFIYVADEWLSPSANERSVPAATSY